MEQTPLDFSPVARGKKQITSLELLEFLKDKRIILSCGHRFSIHNFSHTMIVYNDGQTNCHN
jgi:hypothetical protein